MRYFLAAAMLLPAAALGACSQQSQPVEKGDATPGGSATPDARWSEYHNDRFDFAIAVPPGFAAEAAPANNDGRVFRGSAGELRVFGSNNALGRSFEAQTAAIRDELRDVHELATMPGYWRASGTDAQGRRVHVVLVRPEDRRLVTARFTLLGNSGGEAEQQAARALDQLALVLRAGPATLRYDPARYAAVASDLSLPPLYADGQPATKLISRDRLDALGRDTCRYGMSGRQVTCEAAMEPGLAIAIADIPFAELRRQFADQRTEAARLGGREGFGVTQGAEGEGASYAFAPLGDRTLAVQRLWRDDTRDAGLQRVLDTLSIESPD
jgi:hypothetical protein